MIETHGDANSAAQGIRPPAPLGAGGVWLFRAASALSALAAIGMGYQGWSVAYPSSHAVAFYPTPVAIALALGAFLFWCASILAARRQPSAGLFLLLGYAIPALTLYILQRMLVPPSLLAVGSILAVLLASFRQTVAA
jgi:hypothetical protein